MHRWLRYADLIDPEQPFEGIPLSHVSSPANPSIEPDLLVDSYSSSDQLHNYISTQNSHRQPRSNENVSTISTVTIDSLFGMLPDRRSILQLLGQYPRSVLDRLRYEIQYRKQRDDLSDLERIIPEDILCREQMGNTIFLDTIMKSMYRAGDQQPISAYAAIAIHDYIGDMLRNVMRSLEKPIQLQDLMHLFPLQAAIFRRWWKSSSELKSTSSGGPDDMDIDNNESSSDDQSQLDLSDETIPDSSGTGVANVQDFFELPQEDARTSGSKLYELDCHINSPNICRIGPRIRLNHNRIREQSMSTDEYNEYTKCRQASLIATANRYKFISWIGLDKPSLPPTTNRARIKVIYMLGVIAHDHIGAVVEVGRSLQDPSMPLTYPIALDAISAVQLLHEQIGPIPDVLELIMTNSSTN